MKRTELNIDITNNTTGTIPMNILGGSVYTNDISNQSNGYIYDLTSLVFTTENQVNIQYRRTGAATYQQYFATLPEQSINGLLQALNGLGIGSFFSYTSGGNVYVANYSNAYEFGDMNIYNSAYIPFYYNTDLTPYSAFAKIEILVNLNLWVTLTGGSVYAGVLNNVIQANDSVSVRITLPVVNPNLTYTIYYELDIPSPPAVVIGGGTIANSGFIVTDNFTAQGNRSYYLQV